MLAALLVVAAVASLGRSRRRPRAQQPRAERAPRSRHDDPTHDGRGVHRAASRTAARRRRLPGGAEPDPARRPTSSSGARSSFIVVFVAAGQVRLSRRSRRAWRPAADRIRESLDDAEQAEDRGAEHPRRVPAPAGRRPERGQPHHRGGAADGRPAAPRPHAPGPRQRRPSCASAPRRTSSAAQAAGHGRPAQRRSATSPSSWPRRSSSADLDRDTNSALDRQLHRRARSWSESLMAATSAIDAYADGALRGRPGRGLARPRSRTSCSRSPAPSRANDAAARRRSPTRPSRRAPPGHRRGPARRPGVADHHRAGQLRRRLGPGPRPARDHRPARREGGRVAQRGGRRGPHRRPARRRPARTPGRRPLASTPARSVGEGRRRPVVLGGVVAQVGDTVIDGSVRHRLEQLKESSVMSDASTLHARLQRHRRRAAQARSRATRPTMAEPAGRPRHRGRRRHRPRVRAARRRRSTSCSSSRAACMGIALNLDEESIGAVHPRRGRAHRGGPARQGHRPHPVDPGRRRPARPGRRTRWASRSTARARSRRTSSAASRSRRPASSTASR